MLSEREGQKQITCTSAPRVQGKAKPHGLPRSLSRRSACANLREITGFGQSPLASLVPPSVRHGQTARARQAAAAPEQSASGLCPLPSASGDEWKWSEAEQAAELGDARAPRVLLGVLSVGRLAQHAEAEASRSRGPGQPHSEKDLGCAHDADLNQMTDLR